MKDLKGTIKVIYFMYLFINLVEIFVQHLIVIFFLRILVARPFKNN